MGDAVLVTGGAGFLGSHVAENLVRAGFDVLVVDDLSGGFKENVPSAARFFQASILDADFLDSLFSEHSIRFVYHLAAYAAEGLSHFIKRFNYQNNLVGSVNLVNNCINHSVECMVFTSSIAVYGSGQLPMTEDMIPRPEDSYGIAKWAVEQELQISRRMFGMNSIVFRPHNVYGERQNIGDAYRNVVGIFMNQILQGKPMTIYGDGAQSRAFTYVGDVAPVIAGAPLHKEAHGETFNLGSDTPYDVNQLAEKVAEAMGVPPDVRHLPARKEVMHAYSKHEKARRFFNCPPETPLDTGLRNMADWVKKTGVRKSAEFSRIEIEKELPQVWKKL
jgi:UDP-glucose 4-epimerase